MSREKIDKLKARHSDLVRIGMTLQVKLQQTDQAIIQTLEEINQLESELGQKPPLAKPEIPKPEKKELPIKEKVKAFKKKK